MAKIETGRFSELLRRYLSMAGVVEVTSELAPEISPVFTLESERPEWEFIKGGKLCSSQFSLAASAVLPSTARIRNPLGSQVIAVFTHFSFTLSVSLAVALMYRVETNSDLGSAAAIVSRDTRIGLNNSALIASQQNIAASGDWFWNSWVNAADPQNFQLPFVLTPGFAIDITAENDNVGLRGTTHWLERRMGELESA